MSATQRFIEMRVEEADSRLGAAAFLRRQAKKVFPDHWSFLLGEVALYSFIILILTGIYLSFFYIPSAAEVTYTGGYVKLQGTEVSEAYASTLKLSFDVRGGLLMRQIHHWAALVFVAAILVHMLRNFFTGAFRRPREINWVIGVVLLIVSLLEGFLGYSLPDDLLSGTGLRIANSALMLSVPFIGTYLSFMFFGGVFPGEVFLERMYIIHVLLFPGILLALITVHLMVVWHQKHTQFPGKGNTEKNVRGQPMYPMFMAKTGSFFFFVFGVLAFLGAFAQINPVWLWGPYKPANVANISHPDWYIGFLIGALRLFPGVTTQVAGHTIAWNVFIPGVVVPVLFFGLVALYPWFERWATGDVSHHHLLDRPRNNATRTGIGAAGASFYGVLWFAGGDDLFAFAFDFSVQAVVWANRVAVFVVPAFAFYLARRICLGLQRRDREILEHGRDTGMTYREAEGAIEGEHQPVTEEEYAVLASKAPPRRIEASSWAESEAPRAKGVLGRLQARANHLYSDDDVDVVPGDGGPRGRDEQQERQELTSGSE